MMIASAANPGVFNIRSELSDKSIRILSNQIDQVFSKKGLAFPRSAEELKKYAYNPYIKIDGNIFHLSAIGSQALERILAIFQGIKPLSDLLSPNDYYRIILGEIENWINRKLVPSPDVFIDSVEKHILTYIDWYQFLCKIDGLILQGVDQLPIGGKIISKYTPEILDNIMQKSDDFIKIINTEHNNSIVISGKERGSIDSASRKFCFNAELCLSLLRLYHCIARGGDILRPKIRLVSECHGAYGSAIVFGWDEKTKSETWIRHFKEDLSLVIDNEMLTYFRKQCYWDQLAGLILKEDRSEVEEAIVKSLYWFGEAHKERTIVTKWILLWTCIECYFSIDDERITENNAMGVATFLKFGGYSFDEYNDYRKLKSKIRKYYELRSLALHRASYQHIESEALETFAQMVAWVIIIMVSLSLRGYNNLVQIKKEAERLDSLHYSDQKNG
jgi:hypothetical protein